MDFETFRNAPIVEAMLDVRVNLPNDINLAHLSNYNETFKHRFPIREDRILQTLQFQFVPILEAKPPAQAVNGYLFRSEADGKVVQARLDGFTFHKLKPYESWSAFSSEAKELWTLYRNLAKPITILRLSLRYINRIELHLPFADIRDYFKIFPELPPALPQGVSEFLMRMAISGRSSNSTALVTLALEPFGPEAKSIHFMYDIDAVLHIPPSPADDAEFWSSVESLRDLKNKVFFETLTEATKKLFQ